MIVIGPLLIALNYITVIQMLSPAIYQEAIDKLPPSILYNGNTNKKSTTSYDFIVVGSGSAGSVLANRLSDVNQWNILLLEVGSEPTILTDIPVIAPLFQFTDLNWGYRMEPEPNISLGLTDRKMPWPRGRCLGGSSVINYMIHVRGNRYDYDHWAALGNPGWSYQDVLPYFRKSENFHIKYQDNGKYHSHNGNLDVEDIPYRSESAKAFVKSCLEHDLKYVDYNGAEQLGVSYVHGTLRRGRRCSAEKAFLRPIRHRKNLTILTQSRVIKVLLKGNRAYGVVYVQNRKYYKALAGKEVILSAGAFNSPQLLMLSGIGPKNHLDQLGISVVKDLPVGQKLYDHLTYVGLTFLVNETITSEQSEIESPLSFLNFVLRQRGVLTSLGGVEALAYIKTNPTSFPEPIPDVELIFVSGSLHTDKGQFYRRSFRVNDEIYNRVWRPIENQPGWTVFPMLLHPKSYGRIELKSRNPYHWPRFYGNYFSDPDQQDIKTMVAGIRFIQKLAAGPVFQKYGTRLHSIPLPGCDHLQFDSDQYWECALRHLAVTLHHQISTCKMGPAHDPEAIVDAKLRVYGVENLRVADTSIIPIPLSAHTNIPAYMIGEKAADLLKSKWLTQIDLDPRATPH